jgi:hypothetical protein
VLFLRQVITWIFTALYFVVMVLTFVFVMPVVLLKEKWQLLRHKKSVTRVAIVAAVGLCAGLGLTGCTTTSTTIKNTIDSTSKTIDRASEFASSAPDAPYEAIGDDEALSDLATDYSLELTGQQLSLIQGAADAVEVDPALLATIIESEIRALDPNELDRDVLSAIAGENTSIGIAQVKLSTSEEIEQEDQWGLFPAFDNSDKERTARIKRLSADDWSALYSGAYVRMLTDRFPNDPALSTAQRYTGAIPGTPKPAQEELLESFNAIFQAI